VGALVDVNAETDFVAKNRTFIEFTSKVAELVAKQNPADVAALSNLKIGADTVEAARQKLVQKIGENITVRRFERVRRRASCLDYVHPGSKVAVIVDTEGGDAEVAKDLTHHIAFAKPKYMTKGEYRPTPWPPSARSWRRAPPKAASRRRSWPRWWKAASTSSSPRTPSWASRS
jgi:elongation factor Ts